MHALRSAVGVKMSKIKSFAKLNLYLHVTGKTSDGNYHYLDSLVAFCDNIYDEITITPSENFEISLSGAYSNQVENNILLRTLNILDPYVKHKNFMLHLEKNIPIGSGLGGGSSNAAALIKLLLRENILHLGNANILPIIKDIGADVPICYEEKAAYFSGIGEKIDTIDHFPELWSVVMFPNLLTLTANIFKKGFREYKNLQARKTDFSQNDLFEFLANTNNDLYTNFKEEHPEAETWLLDIQSQEGCLFSRMTGSGSAIFGLFKTKNHAIKAEQVLKKKYKFFIKYSRLF